MEATHPALGLFTVPKQKTTWDSCLSVVSASNIGKGFLLYLQGFTNTGKKNQLDVSRHLVEQRETRENKKIFQSTEAVPTVHIVYVRLSATQLRKKKRMGAHAWIYNQHIL